MRILLDGSEWTSSRSCPSTVTSPSSKAPASSSTPPFTSPNRPFNPQIQLFPAKYFTLAPMQCYHSSCSRRASRPHRASSAQPLLPLRDLCALRVLCVEIPFLSFCSTAYHASSEGRRKAPNPFRLRTSAKCTRNSFRIRTSKNTALKTL